MHAMLMNPFLQFLAVNFMVLIAYIIALSDLYHVNVFFCLYYVSILFFFSIVSLKYMNVHKKFVGARIADALIDINKVRYINIIAYSTFVLGTCAVAYQTINYGATIFQDNMVTRVSGNHYVDYLVNLLQITMILAYVSVKFKTTQHIMIMRFIFLSSVILLALKMNRGAYTTFGLVYIYITYITAVKRGKLKQWCIKLIAVLAMAMILFGYIGDLRVKYVMEEIFRTTINQYYGMNDYWPSFFVWIYIYFTSPLENASRIIFEQSVWDYHYGVNLLYPFLAPVSKSIWNEKTNLFPPLDAEAGLNVSTFIPDAITDFGFVGPYIYVLFLFFFYTVALKSMKNIYGLICYVNVVQLGSWLIFTNAFSIGPYMINIIFFYLCSILAGRSNYPT